METKHLTGLSLLPAMGLWLGIKPGHRPRTGKCGPSSRVADERVPTVIN